MKPFEEQRRFNPPKPADPGEPLRTYDVTKDIASAFRARQEMDRGYLDSIEQNERQELANIQTQADNAERRAAHSEGFYNKLVAFSPTIQKGVGLYLDSKVKEAELRGKMKHFDLDFSDLHKSEEYNRQMALLESSIQDADERAAEAWERTKNYEIAKIYKAMPKGERIGFAKELLTNLKASWGPSLQEQMTTNTTLKLNIAGHEFTPASARGSAQTAAAAKALYRQYLIDNGVTGVNDFFLEQFFTGGDDGARVTTQKILAKRNNYDAQQDAYDNLIQVVSGKPADIKANLYNADNPANFNDVVNHIRMLSDGNGNRLSGADQTKRIKEYIKGEIDQGNLTSNTDIYTYLNNTKDPSAPGKSLASRGKLVTEMQEHLLTKDLENYNDTIKTRKMAWDKKGGLRDQYLDYFNQREASGNPVNQDEIDRVLQEGQYYLDGKDDIKLNNWVKNHSTLYHNKEENGELLQKAAQANDLTQAMVIQAGYGNDQNMMNLARNQEKARAANGNFGRASKAIDKEIKNVAGKAYKGIEGEDLRAKDVILHGHILRMVMKEAQLLKSTGQFDNAHPTLLEDTALDNVMTRLRKDGFVKGNFDTNDMYAPGTDGDFAAFFGSEKRTSYKDRIAREVIVAEKSIKMWNSGLEENEGQTNMAAVDSYFPKGQIEAAVRQYYNDDGRINRDFKMPYGVREWAKRDPNRNSLQILQDIVAAKGILDKNGKPLELVAPPVLDYAFKDTEGSDGISPQLAKLLLDASTPQQSIRTSISNSVGFQRWRIPSDYDLKLGEVVQGSGLDYNLLAGVAAVGSENFDPSVSEPLTTNPQQAVQQFSVINQQLTQQGILSDHEDHEEAMILGFKFGLNTVKFKNGQLEPTAQQQNYLTQVATARAGMGDTSQLMNPSLMNPRLAAEVRRNRRGGSNRVLDRNQVVGILRQAGWPSHLLKKASGMAMLESSGQVGTDTQRSGLDPQMRNEFSIGLLQINWQAHGERLSRQGITKEDLRDPLTNARVALEIYMDAYNRDKGKEENRGWSPWYNSNNKYQNNYEGIQNFTVN